MDQSKKPFSLGIGSDIPRYLKFRTPAININEKNFNKIERIKLW